MLYRSLTFLVELTPELIFQICGMTANVFSPDFLFSVYEASGFHIDSVSCCFDGSIH